MISKTVVLARTTVTALAADHLREEIIRGRLAAGEALAEARVGQLLGVSRAPIREALTVLEREGLITFDRRGTARVCEFALKEVQELGLMRLALEPVAARLAAERRPENEMTAIEDNLRDLKAATRLDDISRIDLDFHRLIVLAAGNNRLRVAWENLAGQFLLVMKRFHQAQERQSRLPFVRESTARAHLELFGQVRNGAHKDAEILARRHATAWLTELEQSNNFASKSKASE